MDILNRRGLSIDEQALREGLARARWRARFEVIAEDPTVIFDGAHNPQGIDAAVSSIKHYFPDRRVAVLTGVLRDKDYHVIAERISEVADRAFTITPDNPRALTAEEYAEELSRFGITATPTVGVGEALRLGMEYAAEQGTALCCLGSLYTYVEVIDALRAMRDEACPAGK